MSQLHDTIKAAVEQTDKVCKEASAALGQINALYNAIPVADALHRHDVRDIREHAVEAKDMAIQIWHDLKVLEESVQALESARGE